MKQVLLAGVLFLTLVGCSYMEPITDPLTSPFQTKPPKRLEKGMSWLTVRNTFKNECVHEETAWVGNDQYDKVICYDASARKYNLEFRNKELDTWSLSVR